MPLASWIGTLTQQVVRPRIRQSLDVLAPRQCPGCLAATGGAPFCSSCERSLQPAAVLAQGQLATSLSIRALGVYAAPLSPAIRRLKYSGRTDLVRPLVEAWWQSWGPRLPIPDNTRLVPVPLHPERLVERGYNQSALLASAWGKLARLSVEYDLLHRIRATRQQARLGKSERAHNLDAALALAPRRVDRIRGSIILVDDVVTTGRTVQACQQALAGAGLNVREVWTLAMAPPKRSHVTHVAAPSA